MSVKNRQQFKKTVKEFIVFDAKRDNNGKPVKVEDMIKILEKINHEN